MENYDDYLDNLAEEHNKNCEPEQIEPSSKHHSGAYNCHHCDNTECESWNEYNEDLDDVC